MRPRHLLILGVLAAVPVALAVALTGGAGNGASVRAGVAQLSLRLVGGARRSIGACGSAHHYAVYGSAATIRFRGDVTRAGPWSVVVKLKACEAGAFQPAGEVPTARRGQNAYRGSFPAPLTGFYFARAELRHEGTVLARSNKRYFEVVSG